MDLNRFDRQISLFGEEGQRKIQNSHVTVIGAGGTGSHVIQQLAYLGIGYLTIIDSDNLEETNCNRLVGAKYDDPVPGTRKTDIAKRLINSINPSIQIKTIHKNLIAEESFSEIKSSNYIFCCVDNDGSRLVLNELCVAFEIPYFDLATDINSENNNLVYGGRVFINFDNEGCLMCYGGGLLSTSDAMLDLISPNRRKEYQEIYGVAPKYLGRTGPSIVSINGVIASLAITEFVVMITGLRQPNRLIQYYGEKGIVTVSKDKGRQDCYYCKCVRGLGEKANIDRYLRDV